jgi:hypothetical protein
MISVVVIDGVTVGRTCCAVHNCKVHLQSNKFCFCPDHYNLHFTCSIVSCNAPVTVGAKTCNIPVHKEIERIHTERGRALFELKKKLERARVAHPNNSMAEDVDEPMVVDEVAEQEFDVNNEGLPMPDRTQNGADLATTTATVTAAATTGQPSKRMKALFGRHRTHNEQLIVAPCGMIMARETFYGAEAVPTVVVSLNASYLSIDC